VVYVGSIPLILQQHHHQQNKAAQLLLLIGQLQARQVEQLKNVVG